MSIRAFKLIRRLNSVKDIPLQINFLCTSVAIPLQKSNTNNEYTSEKNLKLFGDPDLFGTLSKIKPHYDIKLEDEGDLREEELTQNIPLPSQKLTTKQYADIIKDFLKYKRLKEAIDVLEVRMLTVDRVKPENYIYNILIGACADVGFTKKAFKLFNDMKRRGLMPTGDTYTCLFEACANSPWHAYGLKNAIHLREIMIDKGVEPNLTNYNSMIKAFGRCGDSTTAFKIVDEMVSKKIKIRVHTFNHLLHACISDKSNGLRHALIVWRKMLMSREKPNVYSFNLMLKCVKDCDLGSTEDLEEVIGTVQSHIALLARPAIKRLATKSTIMELESQKHMPIDLHTDESHCIEDLEAKTIVPKICETNESALTVKDDENIALQFVDNYKTPVPIAKPRTTPNLLSVNVNLQQVLAIKEVKTVQDKFAIIGGQEDFLKEMQVYLVKPDIKTFTQMLLVAEDNRQAEVMLMENMKESKVLTDIDFYNMLIKKRCLRADYEGAFEVKEMIEKEIKARKRKFFTKKKKLLKINIMTYGVLGMACKTQEQAEALLNEMKDKMIKVNIQILGSLLRQGTANSNFEYIQYIMEVVKQDNVKVNDIFLKHVESFNDKCKQIIEQKRTAKSYYNAYKNFSKTYSKWLKDVNIEEALKPEHPWAQFKDPYPESIQRQNIEIIAPKRFFKMNKKNVRFIPRVK